MKLSLYFPIKPWTISQHFGGNGQYYNDNGINILGHNGIDIIAKHGQPIYAAHAGMAWYQIDDKGGHGVVIITTQQFDKGGSVAFYKTIYWHMVDSSKESVFTSPVETYTDGTRPGMQVKAGDLIGYADSTGLSTGNHLHFGLKAQILQYPNEYVTLDKDNGYLGAIDPSPFLNGLYAEDMNRYAFNKDMAYGETSEDIRQLQDFLRKQKYFSYPVSTGYFGEMTRQAVYKFQLDHVPLSFYERYVLIGKRVGQKTRDAMNYITLSS